MLNVENLSINYLNKPIIKKISFELPKGAICFLSGESGTGKTILCLALAGLLLHTRPESEISGVIRWDKKLISQRIFNPEVTITLENPYSQLTGLKYNVYEEIAFGLEMRGVSREEMIRRIQQTADKFKISGLLWRNPRTLSGGEVQKVVLVSSYVLMPELWILDWPLTELDPFARQTFLQELKKLATQKGTTIIIAEEPAFDLYSIATHLLTIKEKGIVEFSSNTKKDSADYANISTLLHTINFAKTESNHVKTDFSNHPSVQVKELSFRYAIDQEIIFEDLNVSVYPGECLWITGPNGCGKTTLAKIIAGILKPIKGSITINGMNPSEEPLWKVARCVSFAFQNPDLQIFSNNLWSEVLFGPKVLGYSEKKCNHLVKQALELFDLAKNAESHPHDLNRSDKKRLGLASTFSMDTPVIILDEPTQFQNFREKKIIKEAIIESLKNGKVLLVISHDLNFIW